MGYFLIDGLWEAWYKSLKVRPHIRIKTAEALWASSTRSCPSLRGTDQTDRWIDLWRESLIVAGLQVVQGLQVFVRTIASLATFHHTVGQSR